MSSTSQRLGFIYQMPIEEPRQHRRRMTPVEVHKGLAGSDVWRIHHGIAHSIEHGDVWAPWLGDDLSFLPSPEGDVMCV